MKYRFFLLLAVLLTQTIAFSQRTIQMEYDNGIYRIPCVVNGANMKMVFDTGASTVCISLATAIHLYENGFIKSSDFKGRGQSSTASGDIVNNMIINLKDIEIGGMHLHDVECVVMESLSAPLLLGQTAIQKLGVITIRGNQLIINNGSLGNYNSKPQAQPQPKPQPQYFMYNGYKLEREAFVRNLQMGFNSWCDRNDMSSKYRNGIARYVNEIIGFIRKNQCYYELNQMYFISTNYANINRSKKETTYVRRAVYYISTIGDRMVNNGEYIK